MLRGAFPYILGRRVSPPPTVFNQRLQPLGRPLTYSLPSSARQEFIQLRFVMISVRGKCWVVKGYPGHHVIPPVSTRGDGAAPIAAAPLEEPCNAVRCRTSSFTSFHSCNLQPSLVDVCSKLHILDGYLYGQLALRMVLRNDREFARCPGDDRHQSRRSDSPAEDRPILTTGTRNCHPFDDDQSVIGREK
jgi:hypothetical protein